MQNALLPYHVTSTTGCVAIKWLVEPGSPARVFGLNADPRAVDSEAEGLWANHKNDAQTLFTYIYMSVTPISRAMARALLRVYRRRDRAHAHARNRRAEMVLTSADKS